MFHVAMRNGIPADPLAPHQNENAGCITVVPTRHSDNGEQDDNAFHSSRCGLGYCDSVAVGGAG
jgi:hypothetical protein